VNEYTKEVTALGSSLYELLSEALGLDRSHLKEMGAAESFFHLCHYYPPCPEPELTIGTVKHSDASFITIVLQDHIGGLEVLHNNQWIHVEPIHGALVVNVGDLLQVSFIMHNKEYTFFVYI
jgi:isopenicillin N synthase-like dioxygenase